MKYIVTEREDGSEEIFIFSETIHHDCMAEAASRIKNQSYGQWRRVRREPIAAGFTDGVSCWGRSETLNLDSRRDRDAQLIGS
jgi:hypothetical protein